MTIPTTANVSRPQAAGYGAKLTYGSDSGDDILLQVATVQGDITRRPVQVSGGRPNLAASPEDFRAEGGLIFARSEFSGGEGLDRAFRAAGTEIDATRFWDSKDVAIAPSKPGDPEDLELSRDTEEISGSLTNNPHAVRVADGTRVFWADGVDVLYSNDILNDENVDFTTEVTGAATTVTGLALDGKTLYAAMNGATKIYKRTWGGSWSSWSTNINAKDVWVVKRRIIGYASNVLYEFDSAGDETTLLTLDSNVTFTDVIDAGHLILVAATDGKIYAFSDEAGTLILRGETPMRPGEVPYHMAWADGLLFIGVGDDAIAGGKIGRLYLAQLSGVRVVGARLIREWGDETATVDHTPQKMHVNREEVLIPAIDTDGSVCVWAYILSTAGIYRRVEVPATAIITEAMDFDGFIAMWRDGDQIIRENTDYAATGYLISPYADWYTASSKSIVGFRIESADIPAAGAQLDVYYSTNRDAILDVNHASWTLAKSLTFTGDKSIATEIPLLEVSGRGVAFKVVFTRSTDKASTPTMTSISVRAFEDTEGVEITVPVNVSDVLERPGKAPIRVPGRGKALYTALLAREGQSGQMHVYRTGETVKGQVTAVSKQMPAVTRRGASMLVVNVTVVGVNV